MVMATMVLIIGAPANTIGMTAAAAAPLKMGAAAPRASTRVKAPRAPAVPAMRLQLMPELVKLQSEPRALSTAAAATPMRA